MVSALVACSNEDSGPEPEQEEGKPVAFRYVDRRVFIPYGAAITPELAAAHEKIKNSIATLENNTDLGPGYFLFKTEEDSLLQPPTSEKALEGREWRSFVRAWPDEILNEFITTTIGSPTDANVIVALNKKNPQQFYMIFRKSCFFSEASCRNAGEKEATALVYRAFGYAIGIQDNLANQTAVMQSQINKNQELETEVKKFFSIFNNRLEDIRVEPGIMLPTEGSSSNNLLPSSLEPDLLPKEYNIYLSK